MQKQIIRLLTETALSGGAFKTAVIDASDVELDASFRELCEMNSCGFYGGCWMCPPDCGEISGLMESLKTYSKVFVYQTVSGIEDSFDIEGMSEAAKIHNRVTLSIREKTKDIPGLLHLGKGGCCVCERCSKADNLPCRYPDKAVSSLEAYGINVLKLAPVCGMKYINGQNTVTYFGAVFF